VTYSHEEIARMVREEGAASEDTEVAAQYRDEIEQEDEADRLFREARERRGH
jgi:hypothetical protein